MCIRKLHAEEALCEECYLRPVTNSSSALFCTVSVKLASFLTAKLSTDSLVSCCRRPWATRGGCNPCTQVQNKQKCSGQTSTGKHSSQSQTRFSLGTPKVRFSPGKPNTLALTNSPSVDLPIRLCDWQTAALQHTEQCLRTCRTCRTCRTIIHMPLDIDCQQVSDHLCAPMLGQAEDNITSQLYCCALHVLTLRCHQAIFTHGDTQSYATMLTVHGTSW